MKLLGHVLLRSMLAATLVAAGLAGPASVRGQADEEASLSAVRAEIEALERRLRRQTAERDTNAESLRTTELRITAVNGEIARLRAATLEQRERRETLAGQAREAGDRLGDEREALARQVRMSYMTGRQELFRLLLSQETPAGLGRMMAYYDYFNRARAGRIAAVSGELARLAQLRSESAEVESELEALRAAEETELAALGASRTERSAVLARVEASIDASGDAMARLRGEEERLVDLLASLGEVLAAFPVEAGVPFSDLRGRLSWPVSGRLAADFGQSRGAGDLTWNGILLDSVAGTAVRALYHGRVAYSDWLPGLGLLVIVEHGDGYMSLYGHNDALLKAPGEAVATGEAIAQVGDTGGRAQPSLYFEIRRNGEPVNPRTWISGRPSAD